MKINTEALSFPALRMKFRPFHLAQFFAVLFFAIVTGLPVFFLFFGSFNLAAPGKETVWGFQNWIRAFSDPGTLSALWMSFKISVVRLVPAMVLGVTMAWLIARTDMPWGNRLEFLCWLAFFVPDFPMVLAWILLMDPNFGFLNTLAKSLPFVEGPIFNPYSFWGIIWVHTAVSGIWFKVMLLTPIFRQLGASLEEAARVSGANSLTTLRRITLPVLSPMIIAIAVLSFIRGLESFNTELLLGTPVGIYVYSTRIYDYIRQEPPAFGQATALGSVFLGILGLLLAFYWRYLKGQRKFTVVTGQGYSTLRVKLGKWRYVALGGCMVYILVTMVLPLIFLVIGSFMRRYGFFHIRSPFTMAHWQNLFADPIFLVSLKNSLVIASLSAAGCILLYSTVAYLLVSRRTHIGASMALETFCWLPHVMPGILMVSGFCGFFSPPRCASFCMGPSGASPWPSPSATVR